MRCREVEALWDEVRDGMPPLRQAVNTHLRYCDHCQDLYTEYEGVAYCLSSLPAPEPSCDLAKKIIEHLASLAGRYHVSPIILALVKTPVGKAYVGFKD